MESNVENIVYFVTKSGLKFEEQIVNLPEQLAIKTRIKMKPEFIEVDLNMTESNPKTKMFILEEIYSDEIWTSVFQYMKSGKISLTSELLSTLDYLRFAEIQSIPENFEDLDYLSIYLEEEWIRKNFSSFKDGGMSRLIKLKDVYQELIVAPQISENLVCALAPLDFAFEKYQKK